VIETKLDRDALLARIDELLEARYRSGDLGNVDDPLAETVYILLSKQTQEPVYQRIYRELRHRYPRWVDVLAAPDEELVELLRPAGLYEQRARQLKELLAIVEEANRSRHIGPFARRPRDLTLDFLHKLDDANAEAFLTALPGVGPKSARCVLAYSLERSAFAVDTHVHRIFNRLQVIESNGRKKDHDPFQEIVPDRMRKRLHINLVHHGRAVCQTQKAKCGECVLVSFCAQGRKAVAVDDGRPVAVDLFAGAGGLGYGFTKAGYRVALAVEPEKSAAQTYRLNNPGVPVIEATIDGTTTARKVRRYMPGVKKITTLLAGPPCQGYSAAGARDPHAEANLLYKHVARLGKELKAETICLENVPGVQRVNGHGFLNAIRDELRAAGFATGAHLVHACEFGVPQHRARYFFLGRRGKQAEAPPKPDPTHRPRHGNAKSSLPETPRLLDLLAKLPKVGPGVVCEYFQDDAGEEHFNLSTMAHGSWVIEKIRRIKAGEGPISYRRLEADEARTLIAGHRALPVHPTRHRTISAREAAVIQGFPRDYIFLGPRGRQPLQIANAVPPPLAEAVAKHILQCLMYG
jgi:DNA (cytosine-5)-methyltransferase 1